MHSFGLSLTLTLVLYANALDPDREICSKTLLSSAVNSVDGYTYIFKGNYYWKTRPLDKEQGIIGYSDLIKNKWSEIDEPIIAAFTLQIPKNLTVFVCKNKWIAYEKEGEVSKGSTDKWPRFKNLTLNTMFSISLTNKVFAIYDDSYRFNLYDFKDLSKPKFIKSGITELDEGKKKVWFIDNNSQKAPKMSLKNLMKVKTSIGYKETLILFSDKKYCKIDLRAQIYEKECLPNQNIYDLLKCPLDLKGRTTTTNSGLTTSQLTSVSTTLSSQPSMDVSTIDSYDFTNDSISTEIQSQVNDENKSMIIVGVIIGVIVIVVIAVIVGIIMFMYSKKPKKSRNQSSKVSRKTIATLQTIKTVNSNTGEPLRSKSIESLREVRR